MPRYHLPIGAISRWDCVAPLCMLSLLALGISAIHSAQSTFHGLQWRGQSTWMLAGAILYVICAKVDYRLFHRHSFPFYCIGIILLLSIWTQFGMCRYGAVRWIRLFRIQLQPAEVAKVTTAIAMASELAREKLGAVAESRRTLLRLFFIFFPPWLLIFLQPDLGSALILPPILLALLYVSELSGRFFMLLAGLLFFLVAAVAVDVFRYRNFLDENGLRADGHDGLYQAHSLLPLKDYQRNRILGFISPTAVDPNGTGVSWNLRQSLIAVGSGGFLGRGFGGGEQTQLGYLPRSVATNDFLFSALAEEKGFAGAICALILLITLSLNNLRIAALARDRFGRYFAVAAALLLAMHTLINVGMAIGLMPITGVPLPFLSYGGSFLIVCCALQGMVQSIYNRRQNLR